MSLINIDFAYFLKINTIYDLKKNQIQNIESKIMSNNFQEIYEQSINNPEKFWQEAAEDIFTIGLNRAVTMISEAKPGRMSSSEIKNLGEHPEDKKPVRVMKGKYGPYIKYKSLNATIPEEKDPSEITMEEALILIEKRREYDKSKKRKKK